MSLTQTADQARLTARDHSVIWGVSVLNSSGNKACPLFRSL